MPRVNYKTPKLPTTTEVLVTWNLPGEGKEFELFATEDGEYWEGKTGIGLTAEILEEHARCGRAKLEDRGRQL